MNIKFLPFSCFNDEFNLLSYFFITEARLLIFVSSIFAAFVFRITSGTICSSAGGMFDNREILQERINESSRQNSYLKMMPLLPCNMSRNINSNEGFLSFLRYLI